MKKELNIKYILFLLLVPVVILLYILKIRKKKSFDIVDSFGGEEEYLEPQNTFGEHGLNDRQMKVLDYISDNGVGRVSDMVKLFSQTDRTLRRDLNKLENMGFVKRSGSTKSVSYSLVK